MRWSNLHNNIAVFSSILRVIFGTWHEVRPYFPVLLCASLLYLACRLLFHYNSPTVLNHKCCKKLHFTCAVGISNCLWTFASGRDWPRLFTPPTFLIYADTESKSVVIKNINNWLRAQCAHANSSAFHADVSNTVSILRSICLPHLIWEDISIFGINQIYLSFHLHPVRRENSHDALLNMARACLELLERRHASS